MSRLFILIQLFCIIAQCRLAQFGMNYTFVGSSRRKYALSKQIHVQQKMSCHQLSLELGQNWRGRAIFILPIRPQPYLETAFEKAIVVKIWGGQKNLPTQHQKQAKIKYANVFISIVGSLLSVLLKVESRIIE